MTRLSVHKANPLKAMSDSLRLLVTILSGIQSSLAEQYQNDVLMGEKLLNAICNMTVCRLTYQKPSANLKGVIAAFNVL